MVDIFISYAREDRETAKALAEALANQNWSVWWDRHIPSGRQFHEVIERELTAARCVIVLWSKAALGSQWVREEAQVGLDLKILVPVKIEAIQPPIGFRSIQAADLIGWKGDRTHSDFAQLIKDITAILARTRARNSNPSSYLLSASEAWINFDLTFNKPDLTIFRDLDAPWCPEMVSLPKGVFLMGSPQNDIDAFDDEKPQHLVRITYCLAVSRYPVTFDEWNACVMDGGTDYLPDDEGWGRGRRPVINISWNDAQQYVAWLRRKTGQTYGLLSEAEWEYAARAGTTTRRWWGNDIKPQNAHYKGEYSVFNSKLKIKGRVQTGVMKGKAIYENTLFPSYPTPHIPLFDSLLYSKEPTKEVRSYPENPFKLYDMLGNVWEWVEDCWHRNYDGAPNNGAAWTTGDGNQRVLRGGSRSSDHSCVRSASRSTESAHCRNSNIGFRVARSNRHRLFGLPPWQIVSK